MNQLKKRTKRWTLRRSDGKERAAVTEDIVNVLGFNRITADLLYNRGCESAASAKRFINVEDSKFHDASKLKDIDKAIERIRKAVDTKEKVCVYGDYDVDGVTSVSMLYLFLKEKGVPVSYYIPSRDGEGYGLSNAAIDKIISTGTTLIVTVDTGTTANEEVAYARDKGVEMVITDHHECRSELPDAVAVVNPHRPDNEYEFKELAGVGVVFKLLCAYEIEECCREGRSVVDGVRDVCMKYADLTAIGTIADVMPIVDENRLIVKLGLQLINQSPRRGIAALIEAASNTSNRTQGTPKYADHSADSTKKKKKINSGFIGYGLAPRINAAGRISNASKAVELILAESDEKAMELACELCDINRERQGEENRIAELAYKKIEETHDFERDKIIVIEDDSWHQGVIGIVSSRITEKYGLPSVLITFDGAIDTVASPFDAGKGSGRSVKGMNLVEALNSCEDLLCRYGGHELAAGLTIKRANIDLFRERINRYADENLDEEKLALNLEADCEIGLADATMQLAKEISLLEPFGTANPVPSFIMKNLRIARILPVSAGKHTRLIVEADGVSMTAMYFGASPMSLPFNENEYADLLVNIDINEYQNVKSVQLIVQDARLAESFENEFSRQCKRYDEILNGEAFSNEEDIIPTREDFVNVYNLLKNRARLGQDTISYRVMLSLLNSPGRKRINYIKLRYVLSALNELRLCGIEEDADGYVHCNVYFNAGKTNIEKSYILKKLRAQCTL